MLLHFLSDLIRDPSLQQEFSRDPERAMQKAGLTGPQREAVHNGYLDVVAEQLKQEISNQEMLAAVWVKAVVTVHSVSPTEAVAGQTIPITVRGGFFNLGVTAVLQQGGVSLPAITEQLENPGNANTILRGTVSIPASAPKGVYSLVVVNSNGDYGVKQDAFTVE